MKRINTLLFIENLAKFKIIKDEQDTEFIVFENSPLDSVTGITDRTAFEAVENHVHILDDITPGEFKNYCPWQKASEIYSFVV